MIRLSSRLQTICDLVDPGAAVCDVGCDHAHVEIRLLQEGKISSALAMDVAPGPLARARENLELTDLLQRCELRRSDGLSAFVPGEADTLICTGMGGMMIRSILESDPQKVRSFRTLILSPHTRISLVREWLSDNRIRIGEEVFLTDDGKYYTVIRALPHAADGERQTRPDWAACAGLVREMNGEEEARSMISRSQTLRLLEDAGFQKYVENLYGPCVLSRFLMPGSGGGQTQETFRRYLTGELRSKLTVAEQLAGVHDSAESVRRMQSLGGEIGVMQTLLFLWSVRDRAAATEGEEKRCQPYS